MRNPYWQMSGRPGPRSRSMAATEYCDGTRANVYFNVANRYSQKVVVVPTALMWDNSAFADPRRFDGTVGIPMSGRQEKSLRLYIGSDYPFRDVRPDHVRHLALIVDYGWVETKKARLWLVRASGFVTRRINGSSTEFNCTLNVTIPRDRPDLSGSWRTAGFTDSRGTKNTVYIESTTPDMASSAVLAAVREIIRRSSTTPTYAQTMVLTNFTPITGQTASFGSVSSPTEEEPVEQPTMFQLDTVYGSAGQMSDLQQGSGTADYGGSAYAAESPQQFQLSPNVQLRLPGESAQPAPAQMPATGTGNAPVPTAVLDRMDGGRYGELQLVEDEDLSIVGVLSPDMGAPVWLPDNLKGLRFADVIARSDLVLQEAGVTLRLPIVQAGNKCIDISVATEGGPYGPGETAFMQMWTAVLLSQPAAVYEDGWEVQAWESPAGSRRRADEIIQVWSQTEGMRIVDCGSGTKKAGLPVGALAVAAVGAALLYKAKKDQ